MIAKPFIERFKTKSSKTAHPKTIDNQKLLLLVQLTNQLRPNEPAAKKLVSAIFRVFDPSFILISTNSSGALRVDQAWQNPASTPSSIATDIIGKPASSLCELVRKSKQPQLITNSPLNHPNDPLLQKLNSQTYTGFPIFDENNSVTAIISLIDTQPSTYSKFETELLSAITGRIGGELKNNRVLQPAGATENNTSNIQLKAELDAANKSLEALSYAISHDLRAPLRSIDSFSQLLTEDYTSNLPEEALSHLTRIRRAAKRMGSMIDDLLWLSKVTRRKLEKQEMDLSKVANHVLNEIREKHIEYNCEFHTSPHLLINADKHLMKIALQHLLNNACKFSRHREKILISLTHFDRDGEIIYKLTDNGCGFDMNFYDQLFDPFKKLHEGSDYEGTGIGLATVQRIIQRHGGKVWAESELDEGTSVFFTMGAEERTASSLF